jgi:hypothetical protein
VYIDPKRIVHYRNDATVAHEKEPFEWFTAPHTRADFLCQPLPTTVQPQFLQQTPKHRARLTLPRRLHSLISSWSARLPALAPSMPPSGRCLLRSTKTSAPRFYCASRSNYSTLSSSHREQVVTVGCRSNGHITLRQVDVVNFS